MKPVIDGEPIYEEIPHGLHDENELLWKDYDVRRYAYWSVFAGSFGHTYGHNSIMQFIKPGVGGAYGAKKPWYDALNDPGYNQMKYLKNLMLTFPFFERIPDQSIITGQNGERYDRAIATRGNDYLMVYNYTGRPMEVDFSKISGAKKNAWWYTTKDGKLEYIGEFDNGVHKFQHDSGYCSGNDHILIVVDSSKISFQWLLRLWPNWRPCGSATARRIACWPRSAVRRRSGMRWPVSCWMASRWRRGLRGFSAGSSCLIRVSI